MCGFAWFVRGISFVVSFCSYLMYLFLGIFHLIMYAGKRVGYNNMIYDEVEIERIARVAGKLLLFKIWDWGIGGKYIRYTQHKNELAFLSQAGRANTIYTVLLVVPLFECNKKGIRHWKVLDEMSSISWAWERLYFISLSNLYLCLTVWDLPTFSSCIFSWELCWLGGMFLWTQTF